MKLQILRARDPSEIDKAFLAMIERQADALLVINLKKCSASSPSRPLMRAAKSLVKIDDSDSKHESAVDMIAATTASMTMSAG